MKILLKELINPNTDLLNSSQKAVLILTYIAPTKNSAYNNTTLSDNLSTARDILQKIGLIIVDGTNISITDKGTKMLTYHNLIDSDGELTKNSKDILKSMNLLKTSYDSDVTESEYKLLKVLL